MGQKKEVKLEDIANELGVSIVSVSNALKGKKGVSENLRLRVEKKAEEMGYSLPKKNDFTEQKVYRIGIIIAERYVKEYPSFYMEIYKYAAQEATKKGSLTMLEIISTERERLENFTPPFLETEVQGIMIIGELEEKYFSVLRQSYQNPVVCVDFYSTDNDLDYVVTDSYHGMQTVTQKLIDSGHTDIGFVGTPQVTHSIMDRYMGYCKALCANGIQEREDRLILDRSADRYQYQIDFNLPNNLPTAFACNCDKSAYVLIEKLAKRGYRVPEDISVVGFDYFYTTMQGNVRLTTYESDIKAMAHLSVKLLMKRMEGKTEPSGVRVVRGQVIEGDTVRKISPQK